MKDRGGYWDTVSSVWNNRQRLWRKHSDAVNSLLLNRWLSSTQIGSVLKTDLFDEMCGDGLFPVIATKTESFVGIDISPAVLEKARLRHSGICVVAADVLHLPFPDACFDCIVSNSSLDHFESSDRIAESLSELYRVLNPGGVMILTLDNPSNPIVAIRNRIPFRLLNRLGITPYYVGATCSAATLRELLEEAGFSVSEESVVLHCPRAIAVALASLLEKVPVPGLHGIFLRALMSFEFLSRLPTRRLTGYFIAVRAVKGDDPQYVFHGKGGSVQCCLKS